MIVAAGFVLLSIGLTRARANEDVKERFIPAGRGFCYGRTYDAAHLARNPRQMVVAIHIGGRNAGRSPDVPDNRYATTTVRFRDSSKPRTWPGLCYIRDGALQCGLIPHQQQDTVEQALYFRPDAAGLTLEAVGDWKGFRVATAESGIGPPAAADRFFRVSKLPVAACRLPAEYWSTRGPTRKLLDTMP